MLNPKVDLAFKKLFGVEENKDILMSFINSVVDEKDQVKDIILKNPYNDKNFKNDKLSILDVKAQDAITDKWYNIEMQIVDQDYYDKRALYYWARLYIGQLGTGVIYSKLEKTICINILNFSCIEGEEDYHNIYKLHNTKSKNVFFDDLEIHFIELTKYHEEVRNLLDKWVLFLKDVDVFEKMSDKLGEVDTIKKAVEVLEHMSLTKEERERYEARLGWLWDEELALEKAEKKGREEGREEGEKKKAVEIARNLLDILDNEMIAKKTGLSVEEIEKIR
jgi:predicted transposase/invertase (TIGR01784 family)